jgi:hypothetical protein
MGANGVLEITVSFEDVTVIVEGDAVDIVY